MRGGRRSVAVVAVVAALLLAACSGSDDDGAADADGGTTTTVVGGSTPTAASDDPNAGGVGTGAVDWETVDPTEAGFDPTVLEELADDAEAQDSHCLLVARHGRIAGEWYFGDKDEDSTQEVFSATKSLTSILVGIAQDDGDLDIGEPASDQIPEWKGTDSEDVTIRDLLSNDSGRSWSLVQDYVELIRAPDKTAFAIGLTQEHPPGEVWAYNNAAIQTLEQVLQVSTGEQTPDFAEERVLGPIGMDDSELRADGEGNGLAFMGLSSTCRDMARFGQLLLQRGTWDGEQIVSGEYVDEATTPSQELNTAYGYLIWLNRKGTLAGATNPTSTEQTKGQKNAQMVPGAPEELFWALGMGGQVVQVDRASDTVVVRLGTAVTNPEYGADDAARVVTEAFEG
ncbi:MAG: serine hydrolase [Actinobacteria bacterium]|nr:serine hydrolase [Actinomycetota bacterium]